MNSNFVTKALGIVAVATVGTTGTTLTYKYITSLYAIEKLASEKITSWTIEEPVEADSSAQKSLKISVSAKVSSLTPAKHGITQGTWTCDIVAIPINSENLENSKTKLKNALNPYFAGYSSSVSTGITISEEIKKKFVKTCSKNRKSGEQTNTAVTSEVKISIDSLETELTRIFGGISSSISLNNVEQTVYQGTDLNLTVGTVTIETTQEPKLVKASITASNAANKTVLVEGENWTCNIEGIPIKGTDLATAKETSDLKSKLDESIKETQRKGLVSSCARNRTSKLENKKEVVSILKLSVSKKANETNKLEFDSGQWSSVLAGTWKNLQPV